MLVSRRCSCVCLNMEVFVRTPMFGFANWTFPGDSVVREVLDRFVQKQGFGALKDFYVVRNGRLSGLDEPLQCGAVYHLEPRLSGGKGGFGSMLRALGAQIEKTTNREACRDLSGRRLRDVNHEKEMADWLKKQAEREAEKEQRRVERLKRKLREPEHRFSDVEFQQQCHELSERLEDSVIKGLQASSSGQVKSGDTSTSKTHNLSQREEPHAKKKKRAEFWTGLEELQSSEEDDGDEDDNKDYISSFSHISPESMATEREKVEPEQISRDQSAIPEDQEEGPGPSIVQETQPSDHQEGPGTSAGREEGGPGTSAAREEGGPGTSAAREEGGPGTAAAREEGGPGTAAAREEGGPGTAAAREEGGPGTSAAQEPRLSDHQEDPGVSEWQVQPVVDLTMVTSVEQLEVLGLDVLKDELRCRGLKCGGTLTERAARLFSIRGLTPEQINPGLLAKPTKSKRK